MIITMVEEGRRRRRRRLRRTIHPARNGSHTRLFVCSALQVVSCLHWRLK